MYNFHIVITSVEYSVTQNVVLDITVTADCSIDAFTAPASPTDWVVYVIGSGSADTTHVIEPWVQGSTSSTTCYYTEVLTISPDVSGFSWITFDNAAR